MVAQNVAFVPVQKSAVFSSSNKSQHQLLLDYKSDQFNVAVGEW